MNAAEEEIVALTRRLLDSISNGDWATYAELCDPSLTAIEPEAPGQTVVGLDFHKFFFDLGGVRGPHHTTLCGAHVRLVGDVAIICYGRIVQRLGADGKPATGSSMESRVWHKRDGKWRHVHFHRSAM